MATSSPLARDRRRRVDQALDEERRRVGNDRGRQAADQQLEPSHGDPPRSRFDQPATLAGRGLKR
jgi:hypothetical protein